MYVTNTLFFIDSSIIIVVIYRYPALTLLMQSLGSMVLGLEALLSTRSDLPSVIFGNIMFHRGIYHK
jgi:hypothetical protein